MFPSSEPGTKQQRQVVCPPSRKVFPPFLYENASRSSLNVHFVSILAYRAGIQPKHSEFQVKSVFNKEFPLSVSSISCFYFIIAHLERNIWLQNMTMTISSVYGPMGGYRLTVISHYQEYFTRLGDNFVDLVCD